MKRSSEVKSAAFTLTEMLMALALLTLFAASAAPLMRSTFRLMWQAESERDRITRSESMLLILRQDVWDAERIETIDDGVVLHQPKQTIRWTRINSDAIERQLPGQPPLRWPVPIGTRIVPSAGGAMLIKPGPAGGDTIMLVSQLHMLARESSP